MTDAKHDVEPHLYPSVIREMIRHENDLSNHRIMWLLIVQGLIANAYVSVRTTGDGAVPVLATLGTLLTLSVFVILYKSYQARGYLDFLGAAAKRGTLPEQRLPLMGWPPMRIRGWRKSVWVCPWLGRAGDLLEPYFFVPGLLLLAWLAVFVHHWLALGVMALLGLGAVSAATLLFVFCFLWVQAQKKYEMES